MEKDIRLSNIDSLLYERLKYEAERQGMDLKTLIILIIRKSLGLEKIRNKKIVYNDLDYLSGTWSKDEHKDFINNTSELSTIDAELWK